MAYLLKVCTPEAPPEIQRPLSGSEGCRVLFTEPGFPHEGGEPRFFPQLIVARLSGELHPQQLRQVRGNISLEGRNTCEIPIIFLGP